MQLSLAYLPIFAVRTLEWYNQGIMATAFIGNVLPWGQMSFCGAVISRPFSIYFLFLLCG